MAVKWVFMRRRGNYIIAIIAVISYITTAIITVSFLLTSKHNTTIM